jgi:hypothetical protein
MMNSLVFSLNSSLDSRNLVERVGAFDFTKWKSTSHKYRENFVLCELSRRAFIDSIYPNEGIV